ncbi:MAG: hypothetical protein K2W82_16940 [Candidatus Obscuribacterales bacterium]|nr:hypothetical protein [Candidatus Obscuribacterales bacterium]
MSRICYTDQARNAADKAQALMTETAHKKIALTAAKTVARLNSLANILLESQETDAAASINQFAQQLVERFQVPAEAVDAAAWQIVNPQELRKAIAKSKASWGKLFVDCLCRLQASAFAEDLICTITVSDEDAKAVLYTGLSFVDNDRNVEASLLYALARVEPAEAAELRSHALDLWEQHRQVTLKIQ